MDAPKENLLTRKIGPLPAIAWGGIIAAVYVAYKWATVGKSTAKTDSDVVTETTFPDQGISNDPGYGNASGSYNGGGSTTAVPYQETVAADNLTWSRRAVNWLLAQGVDAGTANSAINAYVNQTGDQLNSSQYAAWQLAFSHFGNPPEGVLASPNTTPDTPTPTNPTSTPHPSDCPAGFHWVPGQGCVPDSMPDSGHTMTGGVWHTAGSPDPNYVFPPP